MLIGAILLIVGLLAYSSIPNIHTVPVQTIARIAGPQTIQVASGFLSETSENVTLFLGKQNELLVNITVSLESGEASSLQFRLFTAENSQYCMSSSQSRGCLVDQSVSNETLRVPVNASTAYHFAFDNSGASTPKKVLFSTSLFANSVQTIVAKDGSFNLVGLGLGAIGFLVVLYGASRKTVIPWE